MKFTANKNYYLHNFGIDYQDIFFSERNKKYFLMKIKHYISPYAKVIAVKLANNQFHIFIKTKKDYYGLALNHNIGIMLRSYTRAINKERARIGSLFCRPTKAFKNISDIPKHLRNYIKPFIQFLDKGKLVDFNKTISNFFTFIRNPTSKNGIRLLKRSKLIFANIYKHPFIQNSVPEIQNE